MSITRFYCLLIIFISFPSMLLGQHYQTVYAQQEPCFEHEDGHVKCLVIDSIKYDTDSIFYPYKAIRPVDYSCFTTKGSSWMGEKIITRGDSINLYFNRHQDTIRIKTDAPLNESWVAYQLPDSLTIKATITVHDTMHFLGITDSAKTIGFQAYDKHMDSLSLGLNSMELQVSKKFGWLKTFNFYLFPNLEMEYYTVSYPSRQLETFDLAGLSLPDTGIQNLSWLDVYDIQPGDELHIFYESNYTNPGSYSYSIKKKQILKFLEKTNSQDSVVYRFSKRVKGKYHNSNDSSITDIDNFDTVRKVYYANPIFDNNVPGESVIDNDLAYAHFMTHGEHLVKTIPSDYDEFWSYQPPDSCWSQAVVDGCFSDHHYYKGLGGPYYYCEHDIALGSTERKLVYYKKGNETWGTPFTFTGLSKNPEKNSLAIYPNPAAEVVNIAYNGNPVKGLIEIADLNGRVVASDYLLSGQQTIDVSDLPGGLYFLTIKSENKIISSDKVMIQ